MELTAGQLNAVRNTEIGFIYQDYHLLQEFNVLENITYPMWIMGTPQKEAEQKAQALLHDVNMDGYAHAKVNTLSGGQAQRIAIARALANNPSIILADEPTGNLDENNSHIIWQLLLGLVKEKNTALLCVTHDNDLAQKASRVITL